MYISSEITREQFELIKTELESVRKITKPRKLDLYDVFCAVLYVLKGGIQWRMLPSDFPNWQSVYLYFQIWSEKRDGKDSILELVLKKIVKIVRNCDERKDKTTFVLVDAQSVKNTDTAEKRVMMAGKKYLG